MSQRSRELFEMAAIDLFGEIAHIRRGNRALKLEFDDNLVERAGAATHALLQRQNGDIAGHVDHST
jgi:hypothetical protein